MTLEEFEALHMETRDRLVYRQMRGETLSPEEDSLLASLNATLRSLLPAPQALPPDVQDAVQAAQSLKGQKAMTDPRTFWKIAMEFPPNKEDVYPEHALAHGFEDSRGKHVLEYGCGGGSDTMSFLRRGCDVTFVDIVPENVAKTAQWPIVNEAILAGRARGKVLSCTDVIEVDGVSMDVISTHGVLHHIQDPMPVLKEFRRILKPGGRLYVMLYTEALEDEFLDLWLKKDGAGYTGPHPPKDWAQLFGAFTDGAGCPYARSYTRAEAEWMFLRAGFVVDQTVGYNRDADDRPRFRTYRAKHV